MLGANDDADEPDFQRLFCICDNQKVYQIGNGGVAQNEATYAILEEADWSIHGLEDTMAELRKIDWNNVLVSKNAMTVFCRVVCHGSDTQYDIVIPDDSTQFRDQNWHVLNVVRMDNTSSIMVMGINDMNQFCLMKRPRPAMKKADLIGTNFSGDINDMYFVSENHVVIEKKDRQALTFELGGNSISQPQNVQRILDSSYTLISQQFLNKRGQYERRMSSSRGTYKR